MSTCYLDCPKPPTCLIQYAAVKGPEIFVKQYTEVDAVLTAYTSSADECGKSDGITASGVRANRGTVAAPASIPFYTTIEISGLPYMVLDRGGAIQVIDGVYHIDVWVPTKSEARTFGIRHEKIKIYRR